MKVIKSTAKVLMNERTVTISLDSWEYLWFELERLEDSVGMYYKAYMASWNKWKDTEKALKEVNK